ncbi:MAG: transglycosylase SLT domain-containing protein [Bacteroidota bacterium]
MPYALPGLACSFLFVAALAALGCSSEPGAEPRLAPIPASAPADSATFAQAEALLDEGRPWRAARLLEPVTADALTPSQRLIVARAEGGRGRWGAVSDVLSDAAGLGSLDGGLGLYLLARARDAEEQAAEAADLYERFLTADSTARFANERAAAALRLGLVLLRAGQEAQGRAVLSEVEAAMGPAGRWVDVLAAEALAAAGQGAAADALARQYASGLLGLRARRAHVEAARAAGDLGRARSLARSGRAGAQSNGTRAEFEVLDGRLALEAGDAAAGRSALRRAVALDAAGEHGQAAAALLREGAMTPADRLASARVYAGLGLHAEAAADFRAWLSSGTGPEAQRRDVRLELADVLVKGQQYEEALTVLEPLGDLRAARDLRASALSRAGNTEEAAAVYRRLAGEQRGTDDGAAALYFAADAHQQGGDADAARPLYREVVADYPGTRWAGLATMRLAGVAFLDGDYDEAGALWDRYRAQSPTGEFALQSVYWAGRARAERGDEAAADRLFREVRRRARDSYYALLASERLGEPFWPLPMSAAPPRDEAAGRTVAGWMAPVDRLREAGFYDAASAEADRLAERGGRRAVRYALAEALIERGYAQRAIRIGLGLGGGTNERRLRILYPYPYRDILRAEAAARGFESDIAAALVRQESMFEARITSHVGARGLMQIMPATGAALARSAGIEDWNADDLYQPEVAAFLGTDYLAEGLRDYDGSLPAVFAAYNAGPHQVDQWKTFPEFEADAELFTERIPFSETRDYVKKLTRNRAVYRGLYPGSRAD